MRTKLLAAFGVTVVAFALVAVLGLRALGQANDRVEQLGVVQRRATAYRGLRTQVTQLRSLIALRAGGTDASIYVGGGAGSKPTKARLAPIDTAIATTLDNAGSATKFTTLSFTPPQDDQRVLDDISRDYERFSVVMGGILAYDRAGETERGLHLQATRGEPLLTDLSNLTGQLATSTAATPELSAGY